MAYAITQTCCTDASCVAVCPVNCIHPTPQEPGFSSTEMLYIDPDTCIDCGACADACPVDAIFPVQSLTGALEPYSDINAQYYNGQHYDGELVGSANFHAWPNFHAWGAPVFDREVPSDLPVLDVAVVGTGPAGMYAVADLLLHTNATVTLFDRLLLAGGLVRYGVAPDHPSTKQIGETFARFHSHPRLRLCLGVEVGSDITADELDARHDAVIYAVGASAARSLGIPGEELPGSAPATTAVAWYNGHPEVAADAIEVSAERVVVVGTGNVALDVARILTTDPSALEPTAIPREVLERLRASTVREVVLLGRRGPDSAAYTMPELLALTRHEDIDLVVDTNDPRVRADIAGAAPGDPAYGLRGVTQTAVDYSAPPPHPGGRIVLRFYSEPVEILGDERVRGVRATAGEGDVEISAGGVIRAVGYYGTPVPGLPFDETTGTIPHAGGRIQARAGNYVVGWIKRGPSGGIGANKTCVRETVGALLDDAIAGRLSRRRRGLAGAASAAASLPRRIRELLPQRAGSSG